MMEKIKNWLPLSIYILTVTIFFLYYLFPSDVFKNYITSNLNKALPNINMTVDHIKPSFPPGLKLIKVGVHDQENAIFSLNKISITPGLLSLFGSKMTVFLKCKAYGGNIQAKIEIVKAKPEPKVMIDGRIGGIQTQEILLLKNLTGRKFSSILDGHVSFTSQKLSWGTLSAQLSLSDCNIELLNPVFNLKNLTFQKVNIEAAMNNQNVQVKQCVLKGTQIDGNISGSITLKQPPGKSTINLGGTIKPHPSFLATLGKDLPADLIPKKIYSKSGLPVRFSGTLAEPSFSF